MDDTSFEALPKERQLQVLHDVALKALPHWQLQGADVELLKHRENAVMKITAASGEKHVLRIHREGYRSDAELLSEIQWLDSLPTAGIAATTPLHTRDGSLFVSVATPELPQGLQCDLLAWVPGTAIGSIEEGVALDGDELVFVYERAGELAARVHNHGETWQRPAGFTRLSWDEDGFFGESGTVCGRYWDLEELHPEQLQLLNAAKDKAAGALAAFGKTPDRYGLVHGDMLPENLFYDGTDVRLIDWDDLGFSWHVYDFASALFAHLGRPGFDTALGAMTAGYRRHRAMPDEHLEMIPVLIMARALSYVGWAATRRDTAGELTPLIVHTACELAREFIGEGPSQRREG